MYWFKLVTFLNGSFGSYNINQISPAEVVKMILYWAYIDYQIFTTCYEKGKTITSALWALQLIFQHKSTLDLISRQRLKPLHGYSYNFSALGI